jgi:hypothetical protein
MFIFIMKDMAPELFTNDEGSCQPAKIDVYAFGMLLYYLFTQKDPAYEPQKLGLTSSRNPSTLFF